MWYVFTFTAGFIFCLVSLSLWGQKLTNYLKRIIDKRNNRS